MQKYKTLLFPSLLFFSWRGIIAMYQYFLQPAVQISESSETPFLRLFWGWTTYWDTGHYFTIASQGYIFPSQNFFPAWPLLIKITSFLLSDLRLSIFLLTLILCWINFILFFTSAKKLTNDQNARHALVFFCTFPGTFYLLAGYSENLFLLSTLLAFLLLEKNRPLAAALIGGITSGTRLIGVAVSASLMGTHKSLTEKIGYALLSLWGLIAYMAYLTIQNGDPLLFVKAQKQWCMHFNNCTLTFPFVTIVNDLSYLQKITVPPQFNFVIFNIFFSGMFLLLLIKVFKKLELNYAIYALITIIFPLTTGSTVSMLRYLIICFPVFFVMPLYFKSNYIRIPIYILFFLIQLKAITVFTNALWVA